MSRWKYHVYFRVLLQGSSKKHRAAALATLQALLSMSDWISFSGGPWLPLPLGPRVWVHLISALLSCVCISLSLYIYINTH